MKTLVGDSSQSSAFWPMVAAIAILFAGGREMTRAAPAYDPPRNPDAIHAQVARLQKQVRLLQSRFDMPGGTAQMEAAVLDINAQLAALQGDAGYLQDQINALKFKTGILPVVDDGPRVRPGGDVCE